MVKLSTWLALLLYLIYWQPECCYSEWWFKVGPVEFGSSGLTHKSKVGKITLWEGHYTTTQRSVRQKQVQCYGHNCHLTRVVKAVCRKIRFDGRTIQYACDLEFVYPNPQHRCNVGNTEVNCEHAGRYNEYIVTGSCSFRYTINAQSCTSSGGSYGGPPGGHSGAPPGPPNGHPGPPLGGPSGGKKEDKATSSLTLILISSLVILASILVALIVAISLCPSKRKVRAPKKLHRNIGHRHRDDRDSSTVPDSSTTNNSMTSGDTTTSK